MAIAERRVQADVCQLAPAHMLLFGGDRGEDDAVLGEPHVLCILLNVRFPHGRETQQPQDAVWDAFQDLQARQGIKRYVPGPPGQVWKQVQDGPVPPKPMLQEAGCRHPHPCGTGTATHIGPQLQRGRVYLVKLVEVAVDHGIFRQAILGAGGDDDGTWDLLPSRGFVVDLEKTQFKTSAPAKPQNRHRLLKMSWDDFLGLSEHPSCSPQSHGTKIVWAQRSGSASSWLGDNCGLFGCLPWPTALTWVVASPLLMLNPLIVI